MPRLLSLPVLLLLLSRLACTFLPTYHPANGDIFFHTSRSAQSVAIQRATGSEYSHMGVVYVDDDHER